MSLMVVMGKRDEYTCSCQCSVDACMHCGCACVCMDANMSEWLHVWADTDEVSAYRHLF